MTNEEKKMLFKKKLLEGRMKFKKELKENLVLGSKIKRPKQDFGTFEENLYRFYQKNNPPQFEVTDYIDHEEWGPTNTVYLGRFPANRCAHKSNFPELEEVDLFFQRCNDNKFTVGYRWGEQEKYTAGRVFSTHCSAYYEPLFRALRLKLISEEEYIETIFHSSNLKTELKYFVRKVLKKHKSLDDFINKYMEEE